MLKYCRCSKGYLSLQKLFLQDNQIGNEGAKEIADALKKIRAKLLALKNNQISDKGIKDIAGHLL